MQKPEVDDYNPANISRMLENIWFLQVLNLQIRGFVQSRGKKHIQGRMLI